MSVKHLANGLGGLACRLAAAGPGGGNISHCRGWQVGDIAHVALLGGCRGFGGSRFSVLKIGPKVIGGTMPIVQWVALTVLLAVLI